MIIFIEGTRHSGKTYLLNKFFEQNVDPAFEYYKFYFANWIRDLELSQYDESPALHYFSLGNILTILEMMKDRDDKVLVFDRALLSAYVWAALRKRMPISVIKTELRKILESDLWVNCKTIFVDPNPIFVQDSEREKDLWDGSHSTEEERKLFDELVYENKHLLQDRFKGNFFTTVVNEFNETSVQVFTGLLSSYGAE